MPDQNTFLVLFDEDVAGTETEQVAIEHFGEEHVLGIRDNTLLIRTEMPRPLKVREVLGIGEGVDGEEGLTAIVFKLNGAQSGYWYTHIWEWLDA